MPAAASAVSLSLWVALGGALGSVLRFSIAEATRRLPAFAAFPWATLGINVLGSFALGLVSGWTLANPSASPQLRAFVVVGLLGGFTTFSTFALEGVVLWQGDQPLRAAAYALGSVVLALAAAALGLLLARA